MKQARQKPHGDAREGLIVREVRANSWPKAAEARLRALWKDGHTADAIAGMLSAEFRLPITRNAVIGKRTRLGLEARVTPPRPVKKPPRPKADKIIRIKTVSSQIAPREKMGVVNSFETDEAYPPVDQFPALAKPAPDLPPPRALSILQVGANQCRFALSIETGIEPASPEHETFCGRDADGSWCAAHAKKIAGKTPGVFKPQQGKTASDYALRIESGKRRA
jgi:hypothetical protein